MTWSCAIDTCDAFYEELEDLLVHQARVHETITCEICGDTTPDGYPAIAHVMRNHSRADYVRAYGASPDEIRVREELLTHIEERADLDAVSDRLANR